MRIRNALIAGAAVAALFAAGHASAAVVELNLQGANVNQITRNATNQVAVSGAIAVGAVNNSTNESTGIAGLNMASITQTIDQASSLLDGNAMQTTVNQEIQSTTNQVSGSIAGSGGLTSSIQRSTAASLANQATVEVHVRQR